jgi:protoporphyrinogen/coproporphyrinogen III oxidase
VERPGGSVLFETGPHTLRPSTLSGAATLELVKQIGLEKDIIWVSKDSVASNNRYVKYKDRLVSLQPPKRFLPDSRMFTEPLLRKSILGVLKFGLMPARRPEGLQDESIASFFRRRFSKHIAQNFVSALIHGVYAGDYERLSIRSSFLSTLWDMETAGKRFMTRPIEEEALSAEIKAGLGLDLLRTAAQSRMYTFSEGSEMLGRKLRESVEDKVKIRRDSPVQSIKMDGDDIKIRTPLKTQSFSHVISTIPLPNLFRILPSFPSDLAQSFPPAVTVGVINLYYAAGSVVMPIHGFGYLIPKKATAAENPEDALGVIIVSDAIQGQDTGKYESGVKLTVMLGGHYWRNRPSLPSDDELLSTAKTIVAKDLNITSEPTISNVSLQRECIPQYEVGHWERVENLNTYLDSTFGSERFKVVGSPVDGAGVNYCILAARKAARRIQQMTVAQELKEN